MVDGIFRQWEKFKCYLIPYLILPIAIVYFIDYIMLLLWIIQLCVVGGIILLACGFFVGMYLHVKSDEPPSFMDTNLIKLIPTISIGYYAIDWALSSEDV